jgi:hypothetical protein
MRSKLSLFSATLNVTFPFPLSLASEVTVIQGALLTAVQLHDEGAVTDDVPSPPLSENDLLDGLIVYEQVAA